MTLFLTPDLKGLSAYILQDQCIRGSLVSVWMHQLDLLKENKLSYLLGVRVIITKY